jgi:CelD/BcsL family acetyltransferase involved in cellulose biosynthesis
MLPELNDIRMVRMLQTSAPCDKVTETLPRASRATQPGTGASEALLATHVEFDIELATDRMDEAVFRARWHEVVAASNSPQKIYQTPEFFRFLCNSDEVGTRREVLMVTRRSDGAIVGIVPLQIAQQVLHFKLGRITLFRAPVSVASILGSIPAMPADDALAVCLVWRMLALFPETKAVYMQALPRASGHWTHLSESIASGHGLAMALIGPWQDCHTLRLPTSFDEYLTRFSAKKRYNLNRQIRQLGESAGELELVRVEGPAQIGAMSGALAHLLSSAEMTTLLREETYVSLATQGLLLCYVLKGNGTALAAVIGTRSPDVIHVHNIFVGKQFPSLSVGTSIMHLVVQDLIGLGGMRGIDFGYGTPGHEFRSSHVLETRAKVLVFNRMRSVSLLFFIQTGFGRLSELLARTAKAFRRR